MNIISVKYFIIENNEKVFYTDDHTFDELDPEVLLKHANTIVKTIFENHPDATITQINIW